MVTIGSSKPPVKKTEEAISHKETFSKPYAPKGKKGRFTESTTTDTKADA